MRQNKMGQLSLTIVTSFVVLLTYYLVMFSILVSATPLSQPERVQDQSAQFNSDANRAEPSSHVIGAAVISGKPFQYNRLFRTLRTPFSNSIGQRLMQAASSYSHGKNQPLEFDLLVDDDEDLIDKSKRYDDYGHMRFGKRGDDHFDDYGHMRFGKRSSGN